MNYWLSISEIVTETGCSASVENSGKDINGTNLFISHRSRYQPKLSADLVAFSDYTANLDLLKHEDLSNTLLRVNVFYVKIICNTNAELEVQRFEINREKHCVSSGIQTCLSSHFGQHFSS